MFKEDTIAIKVANAESQRDLQQDIPIARVVEESASVVFVASRSSNLIKSNFSVIVPDTDSK